MSETDPQTNEPVKNDHTLLEDNHSFSSNSRRHFKYRSNECLNCGQPLDLSDRYCPYCSQLNSTKPLSLGDFISEFFSSIVSYDSRLRFTIKDLLFKPGTITRNYIEGQRLKYTNPFRFFLSVSIIYFLVYGIINFFDPTLQESAFLWDDRANNEINFNDDFELNEEEEKTIANVLDELDANPATANLAKKLRDNDSLYNSVKKGKQELNKRDNNDSLNTLNFSARVAGLDTLTGFSLFAKKVHIMYDFHKSTYINSSTKALDSLKLPQTKFNNWIYSKNKTLDKIEKEPAVFINFLLSKTPFFLFFFAPLFALSFSLLYVRRPFTYMEHMLFIFHIFSFIFLSMLLLVIPDIFFDISYILGFLFLVIGPFYFYKALRNFYKQSRLKTIIKFVFLNVVFWVGASIAAVFFFLVTAATF